MKTSKSPNIVAAVAYATAKRSLPPYLHLKSPKKFTQHQLVACLVLREFFATDYRGIGRKAKSEACTLCPMTHKLAFDNACRSQFIISV